MAALMVGGAFLSSFLNVLFDRMASRPVFDLMTGNKDNKKLLKELKLKLVTANQLVDDAEEKQMTSDSVRKWLVELKHALYIVGDLLDEINTEALRRKLEGDDHSGGSSSSSIWDMSVDFESSLEPKLRKILHELHLILNEKDVLGLKEGVKDGPRQRMRQTTSRVDEAGVFGREGDRKTIVGILRSEDTTGHKIGVLPIVGMGGIGKSTLAQLVYKDVSHDFDVRAWVCVGEEFDILRIAETIYGRISGQACGMITDLDLLSEKLDEVLKDKKFLFVLDDVWSNDYFVWCHFMDLFKQFGVRGSKIVATTRDKRVASVMSNLSFTLHLDKISKEDAWLVFADHAFTDAGIVASHPHLAAVGKQIVEKCKGLPLAAKSIGCLLHSVLDQKEWEKVLKSEIWEMPKDKILPALWLSYHYLPSDLKRCFAHCSIYPKDCGFTEPEVVSLWMAEDLLQPKGGRTVEEVGSDYFHILTSTSFFQPATYHSVPYPHFTMHDLINDLAKFVSGEFCLRLEDHQSLNIDISKTRHFSYMKGGGHKFENFEPLCKAKYLRTFLPLGGRYSLLLYQLSQELVPRLQCLRWLELSGYGLTELPSSIAKLKHLRHLDLSNSAIVQLPDTVCTLYNLHTLLLSGCSGLVQLPVKLGKLINLRHLDLAETSIERMPPDMKSLKDLQTLSDFFLHKDTGYSIGELKELQNLHDSITISGLDNIAHDRDALEGNIMSDKKYLNTLVLKWKKDTDDPENDEQVLNKLEPHTNLKELVISSYGGVRFPTWLGDPSFFNLSCIALRDCRHCSELPPLGQLPSLRELRIVGFRNVVEIGSGFYGNDTTSGIKQPFRSLKVLSFKSMSELQDWSYVGGNERQGKESRFFPNLRILLLCDCPKLTKIIPLDNFPKLESLSLATLKALGGSLSDDPESKCPKFRSLNDLFIVDCPNVLFPDGGIDAPKLKSMFIWNCEKLTSLPDQMHTLLPSLEQLNINGCPELESFPPQEEGGLPSKLNSLEFNCSRELFAKRMQWGLPRLSALRYLTINFKECGDEVEDPFPQEGLLPPTLSRLEFCNISNVTAIQGTGLRQLVSLEKLTISGCPELQFFPEEVPNSLKSLRFRDCPKLLSLPGDWILSSQNCYYYQTWSRDVDGS